MLLIVIWGLIGLASVPLEIHFKLPWAWAYHTKHALWMVPLTIVSGLWALLYVIFWRLNR